jgi:alpha-1,6-mannosyltransferase
LAGVAVLTGAWWGLRRVGAAGWLLVTAGLWALPLLLVRPLFSGDAAAYACQGQLLGQGLNPYRHGVADLPCTWLDRVPALWWHTPAPYGPLWLGLARLAAATGHWWLAVGALRLVALAGLGLVAVALAGPGWGIQRPGAAGVWLGLASPLVLLHAISGAHNDALLAGLVLAGLTLATRDRTGVGTGALLGLAVAVKVTVLVAVPFAALLVAGQRRPAPLSRATAGIALGAGGAFAACTAGTGLGLGWLPALSHTADLIQWTSIPTGVGMAGGYLMRATGRAELAAPVLAGARLLGLAGLATVLAALWWRADTPARARRGAGLALAATALLGPVCFPWYGLAPLAVLAADPPSPRIRTRLGLVVAGLAMLVLPDGTGLAALTKPVGAFLDLALVSAALIGAVRVWVVRRRRAGPARPTPTAR